MPSVPVIFLLMGVPVLLWLMMSMRPPRPTPHSASDILVDMHCHTTESDGDRTAEEQLQEAARAGLRALWITDHDMIRDLGRTRQIQAAARKAGVDVSFGVEITVDWDKKEHHLLGYFPDVEWQRSELSPAMTTLQAEVAKVKDSRENRNQQMVSYLNELLASPTGRSYFISDEKHRQFRPLVVSEVAKWAKENANLMEPTSLGRPHFRAYMINMGIDERLIFGPRAGDGVATVTEDGQVFFDEDRAGKKGVELEALMHSATLDKRNIAFRPLPILEAIRLINAAGGRAVLAHPPTLGSTWADRFSPQVPELARNGLWGIEAFSSEIDQENHEIIAKLAEENNLVMTGGSDNHGSLKIYAKLGKVYRSGTNVYKDLEYWSREGLKKSKTLREDL